MRIFSVLVFSLTIGRSNGDEQGMRHYHAHDKVDLIVNTVGPFNNPSETYPYYSLPFCKTQGRQTYHEHSLGDVLAGARKVGAPYDITFLDTVTWRSLCQEYLSAHSIKKLKDAIEHDYFFEFFIDDLPMWGYLGEVTHEEFLLGKSIQGAKVFLYPHLHFTIGFNKDNIVSANVTTDTSIGQEIPFSYSIEWVHDPSLDYASRMNRYLDSTFLPNTFEIHWLSIINSVVLALLLVAFLAIILMRILKNDFSRLMEIDEEEIGEEESGWKMIHGDVFRAPPQLSLFCAVVGAGAQVFFTVLLSLCCVLLGVFDATKRGAILTAMIIIYSLCGIIGGMLSCRLYKQLKGSNWIRTALLTAGVLPVPLSLVFVVLNTIAWNANSTAALPLTTIFLILSILLFVHFPSTILGAVVGKNITTEYRPPCRTNRVPREIPQNVSWYRTFPAQIIMAGFLPFSAIYIELHYVFAAIWGHKIYTLFGILFIAFLLLVVVTSFITIALVYFQLAKENHRWWWRALCNGGATGLFIFAYSFFFFYKRSNMTGWLQTSYFFGYSALMSFSFFLMLGFVGFYSAFEFVNYIYGVVKTD